MWIDVYIPQAAPSGWYSGTVTISNSTTTLATMPVLYGVWQWPSSVNSGYMPSTATLHSIELNGYNTLCSVTYASASTCEADYPGNTRGDSDGADYTTKEDLAVQLLDNRLSLSATTAYFPTTADSPLENGTALPSPRANRIMPGSLQGPGELFWYGTSATESEFQGWASRYTSNSWFNLPNGTYNYLIDEPGSTCSNWTFRYFIRQHITVVDHTKYAYVGYS